MPMLAADHSHSAAATPAQRVAGIDWTTLQTDLHADGHALIPRLLQPDDCAALARDYADSARFRSRIVMARHGFGRGEYQYYAYPLPPLVQALREAF